MPKFFADDTFNWFKDGSTETSDSSDVRRRLLKPEKRPKRIPAGVRVLLALLPVFVVIFTLLILSVFGDIPSPLSGASVLPSGISESDRETLRKYPELFLLQHSSAVSEDGRVLYQIEPKVIEIWTSEIRESQKIYSTLVTTFLILAFLLGLRFILVLIYCVYAIIGKPLPMWLAILI